MGHAPGGGIVSHPGIYTANRSEGGLGGKSATLINGTIRQFFQSAAFSDSSQDEKFAACIITLGRLGVAGQIPGLLLSHILHLVMVETCCCR